VAGREAKRRVAELLGFMELEEKKNSKISELSTGLKRRLLIARSLLNKPQLIVADEPTTGLDPQGRHLIWERLRSLKKSGVTLILTTQYMEEAEQLCDRVVIIDKGQIIELDTPENLKAKHSEPDLEGVFLKITGHHLREEGEA
jgi:lipooligosaccharide transport system ATP-binding protein